MTVGLGILPTRIDSDTDNNWTVGDYSMECSVQYCWIKCSMSRALDTGDAKDAIFSEGQVGLLRAGYKLYVSATSTSAPTNGYSAADIEISFNSAVQLTLSAAATVASVIALLQ